MSTQDAHARAAADASEARGRLAGGMREELQDARILIVDQDKAARAALRAHLAESGYAAVDGVADPREAADRVAAASPRQRPYDLVVLALGEDPQAAADLPRGLLDALGDAPVVALSAADDPQAQLAPLRGFHVAECLPRGQDPHVLALRCERVLTRRVFDRCLSQQSRRNQRLFLNVLQVMAKVLEAKDPYTRFHSDNVARFARQIGRRLGFPAEHLDLLQIAGILHDFGKIGVSEAVLNKPGSLTEEEFASVRRHPLIASTILEPLEELRAIIADIRHHHERWDGGGYPDGLRGDEIPLGARILAVVDAFDAITSNRSYHEARTVQQGIDELQRCAGSQFCPEVVTEFLEVLEDNARRRTQILRPGQGD